jgi:diaminopimelate decarboxylase
MRGRSITPAPGRLCTCGPQSLAGLAAQYGTPLYVYSADQILERLALFQQALAGRPHLVCYAVKANSALAILKLLASPRRGLRHRLRRRTAARARRRS